MLTINASNLSEAAARATPPAVVPSSIPSPETRPAGNSVDSVRDEIAAKSGISEPESRPVSLEDLSKAVEQLENVAKLANRSVQFRISEKGDDIQVLVINEDTDEVIREIPPDAAIELADRIQGTLGLLIDKVV
ncbi:MAG: flagellar protein FlaG [Candidatus Omnitrophica bacterium]|nr:flagellar protein FlaG [Candidatus Omnitrophota bacterium]MCA9423599.1 flagellar protein FlaG [Candidatus Omnitrophota bacterium]MCA9434265.1 flagellar protein FlaG [Candidatus Omnitrophota bacterium]MCA9440273.1 flagellar protein FlaG [Candidatus Omnitrophota bacterium]MCB9770259.1 flagellar protein FlaG [Candidatus Omnitrophota bacterium]